VDDRPGVTEAGQVEPSMDDRGEANMPGVVSERRNNGAGDIPLAWLAVVTQSCSLVHTPLTPGCCGLLGRGGVSPLLRSPMLGTVGTKYVPCT
jgi:hypothetical protein